MLFSIISDSGTGSLVRLHGKINSTLYKEILTKHIVFNLRTAINQPAVFMQDNAPCHLEKSLKTFFSGGCYHYGVASSKPKHESC